MANLYQDTAEPAAPTPPLDGDVRTDVAVVGGGVTGLSYAFTRYGNSPRVPPLRTDASRIFWVS